MKHLLEGINPATREPLSSIWASTTQLAPATLTEHLMHLFSLVWGQTRRSLLSFILTLSSIVVSLLLFSLFLLIAINCQERVRESSEQISVSAYFKEGIPDSTAVTVRNEVAKLQGVKEVMMRNKEEALSYFTQLVGPDSPLLVGLAERNPLPVSLEIVFIPDAIQSRLYERVVNNLGENSSIELVKIHNGDLSQASKAMESLRRSAILGTAFMIFVCGLLITNAIRLTVYANREELEIMQLVGASRAYMSTPFILEGILQGLVGALVSLGLCWACFPWINGLYLSSPLGEVSDTGLSFLSFASMVVVVVLGAVTGGLAALFGTRSVKYEAAK